MRYLFADATPFPLNENFLATLCSATDACVAILSADDDVDDTNRATREAEAKAAQDQMQLLAVIRQVEETFGGETASRGGATIAEAAFSRIGDLAWRTIADARATIAKEKDTAIATATATSPRSKVLPALSTFLSNHQVPDTAWGIRWTAAAKTAPTRAELYARTPFGLEIAFDVAIPGDHLFARPVQASLLEKVVAIHVMKKPLIGKPRPMPVRIDEMYVTAVTLTPDRAAMTLKKSGSTPSEGFEILLDSEGSRDVTVTPIDKMGYPSAQPEKLGREDAAGVHRLWSRVVNTIATLLPHRKTATKALFGGVPVGEVARPSVIAEAIIFSIAPLVREIARRTATPGELALKRFLGDGCREEIFITYETVLERIRGLSDKHHAKFDPFGLRAPSTKSMPVAMPLMAPVSPPAMASSRPPPPMSSPPPPMQAPISSAPPPRSFVAPIQGAGAMRGAETQRLAPIEGLSMPPSTMTPPPMQAIGNVRVLPQVRPPKLKAASA